MSKKILSIVLSIAVLIGLVPFALSVMADDYAATYYMAYAAEPAPEEDGTVDHPFSTMDALIQAVNVSGFDTAGTKIKVAIKNDDYNYSMDNKGPTGAEFVIGNVAYQHDPSLSHKATLCFMEWDMRGDHRYAFLAYTAAAYGTGAPEKDVVLAGPTEFHNLRFICANWDWRGGVVNGGGCLNGIDTNGYDCVIDNCSIKGFVGQDTKTFLLVKVGATNNVTLKAAGLACKAYPGDCGNQIKVQREAATEPAYSGVNSLSLTGHEGWYGIVFEPSKLEEESDDAGPQTVLTPDGAGYVAYYYMKYAETPAGNEDGTQEHPFSTIDGLIKAVNASGKDVRGYKIKVSIANDDYNYTFETQNLTTGEERETTNITFEHDKTLKHYVTLCYTTWDKRGDGQQAVVTYTKKTFAKDPAVYLSGPVAMDNLKLLDGSWDWTNSVAAGKFVTNGYDLTMNKITFASQHVSKPGGKTIIASHYVDDNKIYTNTCDATVRFNTGISAMKVYLAEFANEKIGYSQYKKNLNIILDRGSDSLLIDGGIAGSYVPTGKAGIVVGGALQIILNGGAALDTKYGANLANYVFTDNTFSQKSPTYLLRNSRHGDLVYVTETGGLFKVDTAYPAVATSADGETVISAVGDTLDLRGKPGDYTITWTGAPEEEEDQDDIDVSKLNVTNSMYFFDFTKPDALNCSCNLGMWNPTPEQQGDEATVRVTFDYYISVYNRMGIYDMTGHGVGDYTDTAVYPDDDEGDGYIPKVGRGHFEGTFYRVGDKLSLAIGDWLIDYNGPFGRFYLWNLTVTGQDGKEVPITQAVPFSGSLVNGHGGAPCDCYYGFLPLTSKEAQEVIALPLGTYRPGEEPTQEDIDKWADEGGDEGDEENPEANPENPFANALFDWDTNVEIAYKDGVPFAEIVTMEVYHLTEDDLDPALLEELGDRWFEAYDITLKALSSPIQPAGPVLVHLPIPDDFVRTRCAVYNFTEDGELVNMNAKLAGDYVEFETDHFSIYVLVQENEDVIEEDPDYDDEGDYDDEDDDNPDTGEVATGIACAAILLALALAALVVSKKKLA